MPPEGAAAGAPRRPLIDRLVGREQAVVASCLAAMAMLAWLWLAAAPPGDHAMGGDHGAMPMAAAPPPVWTAAYLLPAFAMWALMMVAMMLPSAAPMILLYSRAAARSDPGRGVGLTAAFLLAYLAVWTLFAAAAALAQALLIASTLIGAMSLALGDGRLAGALLLLAGLYQLSPLKQVCLDRCRSPLAFIMRLSRPGVGGALRLGLAHGLYCLGCCWTLMLLLFAGGVMNLAWIAGLSLIVIAEKYAPPSLRLRPLLAAALLVAGAVLVLAPGYWP